MNRPLFSIEAHEPWSDVKPLVRDYNRRRPFACNGNQFATVEEAIASFPNEDMREYLRAEFRMEQCYLKKDDAGFRRWDSMAQQIYNESPIAIPTSLDALAKRWAKQEAENA